MLRELISGVVAELPLDRHERRAAAQLMCIQAAGERLAQKGALAQAGMAPSCEASRFLLRQSRQEAFHAHLFAAAAWALDDRVNVSAADEALARIGHALNDALERADWRHAVVIQHVALEGLGHAVLEHFDAELPESGGRMARLRRMILAQEEAHFAFGSRVLACRAYDQCMVRIARQMLDEAERLLAAIGPDFRVLGGDVADVIDPLRASVLASIGTAT